MPLRPFRPSEVCPRCIQHTHQKGTQTQCDRRRHLVVAEQRGRPYREKPRNGRDSDDGKVNKGAKSGIAFL